MAKFTTDPKHDGKRVGGEISGVYGQFTQKQLAAMYANGNKRVIKIDEQKPSKNEKPQADTSDGAEVAE